jgi:hypothetical protein
VNIAAQKVLGLIGLAMAQIVMIHPGFGQPGGPQFDMTKVSDSVYSFRFFTHRNMIVVTSDGRR